MSEVKNQFVFLLTIGVAISIGNLSILVVIVTVFISVIPAHEKQDPNSSRAECVGSERASQSLKHWKIVEGKACLL